VIELGTYVTLLNSGAAPLNRFTLRLYKSRCKVRMYEATHLLIILGRGGPRPMCLHLRRISGARFACASKSQMLSMFFIETSKLLVTYKWFVMQVC